MTPEPNYPQPPFRSVLQAQAFLDSRVNLERIVSGRAGRMSLDPMKRLLAAVGHPERSFRSVHVGGTVGKGSTARFLASMLQQRGEKVGLYTSPHLERMSERITVDGAEIGESAFCEAMSLLAPHAAAAQASYFDLLTAAAFLHFQGSRVGWAVIEVGLGGRLDSTNVVQPELCVITNVGSDHADALGATVAQRAREKGGIVKPEIPLVTDIRDAEAFSVVESICSELRAPLVRLAETTPAQPSELPGFQRRNLALARLAFDELARKAGWRPLSDEEWRGAAAARLPGRCEIFPGDPRVVLDGAHMPEAIEALLAGLEGVPRPRALLFGASADKDAGAMLKMLARWADRGVMCAANSPRAIPPANLLAICDELGLAAESRVSPEEALALGRAQARGGTLLVTGSLYLVGEIRALLREER